MTNHQPQENKVIELPNMEQLKKGMFVVRDNKFRRQYATKLEKYFAAGSLNEDQFKAGTRLYGDCYHGGVLSQIKAIDYTRAKEGGGGISKSEMSWYKADKHKQFSDAMFNTEIGRVQREILWHVCIFDNDISSFAGSDSRHYAIGLLRETLNELARHYKRKKGKNENWE